MTKTRVSCKASIMQTYQELLNQGPNCVIADFMKLNSHTSILPDHIKIETYWSYKLGYVTMKYEPAVCSWLAVITLCNHCFDDARCTHQKQEQRHLLEHPSVR